MILKEPEESFLQKKLRAKKINQILANTYPHAKIELNFATPFQLLVATVLSAQTTDIRVNSVSGKLFSTYPNAQKLANANYAEVENILKTLGLFRVKSKNIIKLSQQLITLFHGEVPKTLTELTQLAGVGRKTANVVLGNIFATPAITVDTHFRRISLRLALTVENNPEKIELAVCKLFPKKDWVPLSHRIIFHGRNVCYARKPACPVCPIKQYCPSYFTVEEKN